MFEVLKVPEETYPESEGEEELDDDDEVDDCEQAEAQQHSPSPEVDGEHATNVYARSQLVWRSCQINSAATAPQNEHVTTRSA